MNFLSLIVFSAFLGTSSCDLVCMQIKQAGCLLSVNQQNHENPMCNAPNELTECFDTGAQDCRVKSEPIVNEMINIYRDTCREGSEMNRLLKEHTSCLFGPNAPGHSECHADTAKELRNLVIRPETRNNQIKFFKIGCKNANATNQCVDNNINRTCGPEALKFRWRLINSTVELTNQACIEAEGRMRDIITSAATAKDSQNLILIFAVIYLLKYFSYKYV